MRKLIFISIMFLAFFEAHGACDGSGETLNLKDPVNGGVFDVEAKVYRPLGNFPVVFILPPSPGDTPLDQALAVNMCLVGMGVYVLDILNDEPFESEITNLNSTEDSIIRADLAVSSYIDKLEDDANVSGRFGILGASLGGMLAAHLAGSESRLSASVFIAAGGNISTILANSTEENVKKLREARMERFGLTTKNQYKDLIDPYISGDPLFTARNIPKESSMIFVLNRDTEVPTVNQRQLRNALNEPKVVTLNADHILGIVEASTIRSQEIVGFLKDRLGD